MPAHLVPMKGRYHRWRVLGLARKELWRQRQAYCVCQCDCGKIKVIRSSTLRAGDSRSCGCLMIELAKQGGPKPMCWKGWRARARAIRDAKNPKFARDREDDIVDREFESYLQSKEK